MYNDNNKKNTTSSICLNRLTQNQHIILIRNIWCPRRHVQNISDGSLVKGDEF